MGMDHQLALAPCRVKAAKWILSAVCTAMVRNHSSEEPVARRRAKLEIFSEACT